MKIFTELANAADAQAQAQLEHDLERIRSNLSGVKAIVAIASAKGGVGKSIVAVNVAGALALKGRKVALVDADFNAPSVVAMLGMKRPRNLPMTEGIEPVAGPHGLRVVASDLIAGGEPPPVSFLGDDDAPAPRPPERPEAMSYAQALRLVFGQSRFGALDYLVVDLGPGLGNLELLSKTVKLDGIILMSNPSGLAAGAARDAVRLATATATPVIGIVENMAGFHCDGCRSVRPLWPEGGLPAIAREADVPILARFAFDPRLAEASDRGVLFVHAYADTPIGKSLTELALRVETILASRARVASAVA
jgi:ATP-binding protein involved in chromosome partitioning